jgi:hypothetical protein
MGSRFDEGFTPEEQERFVDFEERNPGPMTGWGISSFIGKSIFFGFLALMVVVGLVIWGVVWLVSRI